jgi:FkbM family methyltransferase
VTAAEFIYTTLLKPRHLRIVANALLRAMIPRVRVIRGAVVHLNPDDPVVSGALALGVYEQNELRFFETIIEPTMTFVDVGANIGVYTALALCRMKEPSRIVSIEPDPATWPFLQNTVQSNLRGNDSPKVSTYQLALSDAKGPITLHRNPENRGDNRIYDDPLCPDRVSVSSELLDSILEKEGVDTIQLIKIDVQGAEAKVLAGAVSVLSRSPDCLIMTEFWPFGLLRCGSSPKDYLGTLEDLGFQLYSLDQNTLFPIQSHEKLIESCPGRVYRNLIGAKGQAQTNIAARAPTAKAGLRTKIQPIASTKPPLGPPE